MVVATETFLFILSSRYPLGDSGEDRIMLVSREEIIGSLAS